MNVLHVPYFKQDTLYTCGPTSLQMVLAFYGMRESEASLAREVEANAETGTTHERMIEAVRARGLHCYVNDNAGFDELRYLHAYKVPVIIRFLETGKNEDHYGVLVGVSGDAVLIHDPWHGPSVRFNRSAFLKRWTCDMLGNCSHWLMAVSDAPLPFGRQFHPHG